MEKQQEILQKIQSADPTQIAEAIQEIKENGDLSIAKIILDTLPTIQDLHTRTTLINLLADIKENAFKEVLINQIQTTTDPNTKIELLRIIWESSLNYSEHLSLFLDILQHEDFTIAFEASTVVENILPHLTTEQLHELHQFIEDFPADKQFLITNIHAEMGCCEND